MTSAQPSEGQMDGGNQGELRITAASKVFNLPELLHIILMEMPTESHTLMEMGRTWRIAQPAIDLLWLQRVNHTFFDCIHTAEFKQRMTVSKTCPDPIVWFAHWMGLRRAPTLTHLSQNGWATIEIDDVDLWHDREMVFINKKRAGPDASWRKWPISYTVRKVVLDFRVVYRPGGVNPFSYREHWDLEAGPDGATLGNVYDMLMEVSQRTTCEHRHAKCKFQLGRWTVIKG